MPKHVPERTCIVTREERPQAELMRFVLGPDGHVVADLRHKLPGRGAWLSPTRAVVEAAMKKRLFARAFKTPVEVPATLPDEIDAALVRDVKGSLALANKAGAVVAGFGKVEAALSGTGAPAALIHAREAAPDGRRKLAGLLRRIGSHTISPIPTFDDLGGGDLDVALGRVGVIHAALLAGAGGVGCLARWRRLRLFRGVEGGPAALRDGAPDEMALRDDADRADDSAGADGQG